MKIETFRNIGSIMFAMEVLDKPTETKRVLVSIFSTIAMHALLSHPLTTGVSASECAEAAFNVGEAMFAEGEKRGMLPEEMV